jgi:hypothetical protein
MLERILNEIKYDRVSGTIKVDGKKIYVNVSEKSDEEGSYQISQDGEMFSITITGKTCEKSLPCACFEIYRNVAHLFYKPDTDVLSEKGFYNSSDFLTDNADQLCKDMWLDKWASNKREWNVTVDKILPLMHKEDIVKLMPDVSDHEVNETLKETNSEIKFRRTYLTFLKDMYLEKHPKMEKEVNKNKKISPLEKRRLKQGLFEVAESMGYYPEKKESPVAGPNQLATVMSRMGLSQVTNTISFEDGMKTIMRAINREDIKPGRFNIQSHRYILLNHEPDDWKKKYHEYYFKSGSVYVPYAKSEEGTPEFIENNTYEKLKINKEKAAFEIIKTYERITNDFLKMALQRFQYEVYLNKRKEIAQATINILGDFASSPTINTPTMKTLDEMIQQIRLNNSCAERIKTKTTGMLSYNERKKIFIDSVERRKNESDEAFKKRAEILWEEKQRG